jgi:hypothetical protein
MRALVSLYHQADSFITPETLSDAIDHAFFESRTIMDSSSESREKSHSQLRFELEERRIQPKLSGSVDDDAPSVYDDYYMSGTQSDWSARTPERVRKLKAALYGMDDSSSMPLPGYEVLVEEHERVQKLLREEREHGSSWYVCMTIRG